MEDVEAETMTALTPRDVSGQDEAEAGDEVEDLRNSLREAVHDDNVRPKMQCLMMDSSFSMVTMQGEDSGIAWETTPSRCTTPWLADARVPAMDLGAPVAAQPRSVPAGKIIFLIDEELMSRRRTTKERTEQKTRDILVESSEDVSGRPELVEFSQPNVKMEDEEEARDPLFSLVSEGSEILNIVVPPKLATVDEEESKDMEDNLGYLEDSFVLKASEETQDSEVAVTGSDVKSSSRTAALVMDPPGAPVVRPLGRGPSGNVDYFEAFALIDTPAPGSPAVIAQVEQDAEVPETQDAEGSVRSKDDNTSTTVDKSDTISLLEIASELLDEVFYGGTDNYATKPLDKDSERGAPSRLPSKPSGSTLFGSQEDILTPIFLPEGPPKIIDQILLEEPKAMAFLYTDLYEEAVGCRKTEEDTESLTSEKSFHSRHSDREARGYLEKFVLIDETPALEVEPANNQPEEGPRVLTQDLYNYGDMISKPEKGEMPNSEEEITDFFRSSANSSPCELEPFSRTLEEDDETTKDNKSKSVSIKVEKVQVDPLCVSGFEFVSEEPDWGGTDDHPAAPDEKEVATDQELWKHMHKPVAPPRRKAPSSPKERLDLTPLVPIDVVQEEEEEAGGKEKREEEKETASPAETADEGDREETMLSPPGADLLENVSELPQIDGGDEKEPETEEGESQRQTEATEAEVTKKDVYPEKQDTKDKGQCVIL